MKKPLLSALLNGVLPGLGYIYNGQRVTVGLLLFAYSLITLLLMKIDVAVLFSNVVTLQFSNDMLNMLVAVLLIIAMAMDSYREAVEVNSRSRRRRSTKNAAAVASSPAVRKQIKK